MKVLNNLPVRWVFIPAILLGIACLISPREVERSKWLSYSEWMKQHSEQDQNQQKEKRNQPQTLLSWSDFHQSQTARQILTQSDDGLSSTLSAEKDDRTLLFESYFVMIEMLPSVSINEILPIIPPLALGISIGAP